MSTRARVFLYRRNSGIWRLWASTYVRSVLVPLGRVNTVEQGRVVAWLQIRSIGCRRGRGNTGNLREAGRYGIVMVSWKTAMLAAGARDYWPRIINPPRGRLCPVTQYWLITTAEQEYGQSW